VSKPVSQNEQLLFQYFGYDPNTFVDADAEADRSVGTATQAAVPSTPRTPNTPGSVSLSVEPREASGSVFDQPPPRLPRPLSKLNCVQARTTLARLLRYQQAGNNPVYGSPDTRPPWY
jgi:hypothetical protein